MNGEVLADIDITLVMGPLKLAVGFVIKLLAQSNDIIDKGVPGSARGVFISRKISGCIFRKEIPVQGNLLHFLFTANRRREERNQEEENQQE